MRTPDDVRRFVDEALIISKAEKSAINDDEDIDKADAPSEGDEPPTISPTIEDGDEAVGPEQEAARASARRAAFKGEAQFTALSRVRRQWPNVKDAEAIVAEAYEWYDKRRPGRRIKINNIVKIVSSMEALNEKFAMLEVPGQPACIIKRSDAMPVSLGDFKLRLNGTVVCLGIDSEGAPKWGDAQEVWRKSADKHVYNTIAFTSKPVPAGTMNLFKGFGVKPKKGDCHLIHEFLLNIICNNNAGDYTTIINLIAWQIQNIGTASRIVVILFSKPQQVGKGTLVEFILLPIFGDAGFVTTRLKDITGEFNAVLRGKALVGLDETLFAGDHVAADQIKGLVATDQIPINEKFLPRVKCPAGNKGSILTLWRDSIPRVSGRRRLSMRGGEVRSGSLFSYVDVEARVPRCHPLRAIRALVDASARPAGRRFRGDLCADRPAVDRAGAAAAGAVAAGVLHRPLGAAADGAAGL